MSRIGRALALAACPALLALGACGTEPGEDAQGAAGQSSGGEAAEDASSETDLSALPETLPVKPRAGRYNQTVEVTKLSLPGLSDDQAGQLRAMMEGSMPKSFCLTPEEAERGYRDMMKKAQKQTDCTYERFDASGGRIDAVMSCKQDGAIATMTMAGDISETASDVTMTVREERSGTSIDMHMVNERVGDC